MKKLITGAIAAAALLFGFASCTGLHDNATQPLKITGNLVADMKTFGEWLDVELVTSDGSEQKYEFTATEGKEFKLSTAGSWATDIAGDDINSVYPVINGDYIDLHSREAEALPNTQNVVINDMTVGEKYVMLIKYNPTTKATSVKITGSAVVMPALDIVVAGESKNFPAKDKDGNDVTYTMKRSGTEYTYQFIASETETVSFHLESATAGLTYGGATLTTSDAALTVYDKTDMSTSLVKDHEYKLTVKVPSLTAATIKTEEVSMLKNASIKANWKYADNFYEVDAKSDGSEFVYTFTAERTEVEFTVNRVKDSADKLWAADTTSSLTIDGTAVTLKYLTDTENAKAEDSAKKLKIANLKVGSTYKLTFTVDNTNFTFSAKVANAPLADLSDYLLAGSMNGWPADSDDTNKLVKNADGTYSVEFTANGEEVECKIHLNGDWNTDCWTLNDSQALDAEAKWHISKEGEGNSKITGLTSGTKYKLTVTPGYGDITVKVTVAE